MEATLKTAAIEARRRWSFKDLSRRPALNTLRAVSVSDQGTMKIPVSALPAHSGEGQFTLASHYLYRRCGGKAVDVKITKREGNFAFGIIAHHIGQTFSQTFYLDGQNMRPYFFRQGKTGENREIHYYPIDLMHEAGAIINGIAFYRGYDHIGETVLAGFTQSGFAALFTVFDYKRMESMLVRNRQGETNAVIACGTNLCAPFILGLSGYLGPMPLVIDKSASGASKGYLFPAATSSRYSHKLLQADLDSLGLSMEQGISARIEEGFVMEAFSPDVPANQVQKQIFYRVVRDEKWKILNSSREDNRKVDWSGIKIVEGAKVTFPPSNKKVIGGASGNFRIGHRQFTRAFYFDGNPPESMLVSMVIIDGEKAIFIHKAPRFCGTAKWFAEQMIAAHESKAYSKKMQKETEAACAAKAKEDELAAIRKELEKTREAIPVARNPVPPKRKQVKKTIYLPPKPAPRKPIIDRPVANPSEVVKRLERNLIEARILLSGYAGSVQSRTNAANKIFELLLVAREERTALLEDFRGRAILAEIREIKVSAFQELKLFRKEVLELPGLHPTLRASLESGQ